MMQWLPLILGIFGTLPWWSKAILPTFLKSMLDKYCNPSAIRRVGICCMVLSFMWANFNVWKEQRTQITNLTKNLDMLSKPKLNAELTMIIARPAGENKENTLVFLTAIISNTGAPSIAKDMQVTAITNNKKTEGTYFLIPLEGYRLLGIHGEKIALKYVDYLPNKSLSQPIPTGGAVSGFCAALFSNVTMKEIHSGGTIILTFKDVLGNSYSAKSIRIYGSRQAAFPNPY